MGCQVTPPYFAFWALGLWAEPVPEGDRGWPDTLLLREAWKVPFPEREGWPIGHLVLVSRSGWFGSSPSAHREGSWGWDRRELPTVT